MAGVQPRKTSGISLPYRSRSTNQYKVSIAVPIWNKPRTEVLGVLARSIALSDLLNHWESEIGKIAPINSDHFLALVDMRGVDAEGHEQAYLLDHPWLSEPEAQNLEDDELKERLRVSRRQRDIIQSGEPSAKYEDPIGGKYEGPWLAAFAPVGTTGWYAIVQERRSVAVDPVQNLRAVFMQYGLGALAAMTAVFALLGALLWRASR
jgi:hypothetical protein